MNDQRKLWTIADEHTAYVLGSVAGRIQRVKKRSLVLKVGNSTSAKFICELLPDLKRRGRCLELRSEATLAGLHEAGVLAAQSLLGHLASPMREAFTRGLLESAGQLPAYEPGRSLRCDLKGPIELLDAIQELYPGAGVVGSGNSRRLRWRDENALDLLGQLYTDATVCSKRWKRRFSEWAGVVPTTPALNPKFAYQRLHPEAVAPFKARVSDSGYDLTVVRRVKQHGLVTLFGTGLSVRPPFGWYFDVVPRSSLVKTGYVSANSVGVIDRSYRGEIMVPLIKLDADAPELELPARIAQLVPRPIVHFSPISMEALNSTQRGAGGFGSTDR